MAAQGAKSFHIMNTTRFIFCILLAAFVCAAGCSVPKPVPDPVAGWQKVYNHDPDPTIVKDYQDYIQKLPPEEKKYVGVIDWFEDGTGQHAVKIEIGLNGISWVHVLIYDKDNKRIKAIKYSSGSYRS
jgi:hypothetical protein